MLYLQAGLSHSSLAKERKLNTKNLPEIIHHHTKTLVYKQNELEEWKAQSTAYDASEVVECQGEAKDVPQCVASYRILQRLMKRHFCFPRMHRKSHGSSGSVAFKQNASNFLMK